MNMEEDLSKRTISVNLRNEITIPEINYLQQVLKLDSDSDNLELNYSVRHKLLLKKADLISFGKV